MGNNLTIRGPWLKKSQIQALIDAYAAPLVHASRHQDGGADEITVQALSGVLAAEQLSSWNGVSGKPTTFAPAAHKTSHEDGGSDEVNVTGLTGLPSFAFGALTSKAVDTVYLAATDGIVVAFVYADNDADRGHLNLYTDLSNPPTTEITKTMAVYYSPSDVRVFYTSITVPIPKNNYWKVSLTNDNGVCPTAVFWLPIS